MFYLPLEKSCVSEQIIELDGVDYFARCRFNSRSKSFVLDLRSDALEINGIRLVGALDLLDLHAHIELGAMIVIDSEYQAQDPIYEDFGVDKRFKVLYLSREEINKTLEGRDIISYITYFGFDGAYGTHGLDAIGQKGARGFKK